MENNRAMPRNFADKLLFFRQKKKLTCKELGQLAGIDSAYVNRHELGKRRAPSYPIIKSLANALNVEITDLIDIDSKQDVLPIKSVQEVMLDNEYLINDKLPTKKTREYLLELIQTMLDSMWENDSKHTDTVNIVNKVDAFLNSIK